MHRNSIKIISIIISITILLLLILYADPKKFFSLITGSDYTLLLLAFVISTLNNVFLRILKWKVLLGNVKLLDLLPVQLLGITISNFSPGKIAEPVKSVILKMRTGMPVAATLPSVIWERIIDVLVLLLLSAFGMVLFLPIGDYLFVIGVVSFIIFIVVVGVAFLFLHKSGFRVYVFRFLKKLPIVNRISESFIETFGRSKIKRVNIFYSFIITFAAWVVEGFIIHFSLLSIGVNISPIILASIFALATIIGIATALPGGIGSTDVVMVLFLGILGVGHSLAITGVLLSRFLSIWYVNLLGGISLIYLTKKSKLDYKSIFS